MTYNDGSTFNVTDLDAKENPLSNAKGNLQHQRSNLQQIL